MLVVTVLRLHALLVVEIGDFFDLQEQIYNLNVAAASWYACNTDGGKGGHISYDVKWARVEEGKTVLERKCLVIVEHRLPSVAGHCSAPGNGRDRAAGQA